LFAALWLLDYFVIDAAHRGTKGPVLQLFDFDAETMQNAIGSLAQVIAAVLASPSRSFQSLFSSRRTATRRASRTCSSATARTSRHGVLRDRLHRGLWVGFGVTKDYVPQATITATLLMRR